ncbi:MAG: hypothetical protein H6705_16745 [Myxococcales bacterium]|nr:hypothetical protein [Myxococcales bacterium]
MTERVPPSPPAGRPSAASMLLGRPVRPETMRALGEGLIHYGAVRCQRAVCNVLCHGIDELLASAPVDLTPTVDTLWTLGPLASRVVVAVRAQAARPKGGANEALISVALHRRSDNFKIDDTGWAIGTLDADAYDVDEAGVYPARWYITPLDAAGGDDPRPLEVDGEAGEPVRLEVTGEDVRIIAVAAWEVWPSTV